MKTCEECNGKGTKIIRTINLYETCKKCHGDGKKLNWLEKAIGKRAKYKDECVKNNLSILMQCLQDYCKSNGYHVEINITNYDETKDKHYNIMYGSKEV